MKSISFIFILLFSSPLFGQVDPYDVTIPDTLENGPIISHLIENMPEFPSGSKGLELYVKQHLTIPELFNGKGRVVVSFVVEKTGKLTHLEILKSLSPSCDNAVISLFESMPNWIPGSNNNNKVRIRMVCPIYFYEGKVSTYSENDKGRR